MKRLLVLAAALPALFLLAGCADNLRNFADDKVVAEFSGGEITVDQLGSYISKFGPKCHNPMAHHAGIPSGCDPAWSSCELGQGGDGSGDGRAGPSELCCGGRHGGTHAGCCGGSEAALASQPCTEHGNCCEQHYDLAAEDYRRLVQAMVLKQVTQDYIREKRLGQETDTQDAIRYVTERVYVEQAHLDMEEAMRPSESEIRAYYEANEELFGIRTVNEVRGEIETTLRAQMHQEYMPRFLEELKKNAFIVKSLEILEPQEPSEYDLRDCYERHRADFVEPEAVRIRQIIASSREKVERARQALLAGESFADVARKYSEEPYADGGGEVPSLIRRGQMSQLFDDRVFSLQQGQMSELFQDGEKHYLVQVLETRPERTREFEELADQIRDLLLNQREAQLLEENAKRTLFTVNDRSFTVQEVDRSLKSLPAEYRAQYTGRSGIELLVERLIEYELLVDDAREKKFDPGSQASVQDVTQGILEGTLYEKEVIDKVKVENISSQEALQYYRENREGFATPPEATVSYVRIPVADPQQQPSGMGGEGRAAEKAAQEAYQRLLGGEDFGEIARSYSVDPWSSRKVILRDAQGAGSTAGKPMHPLLEAVFQLEPGGVSKPFALEGNWFIFKLWEKKPRSYPTFEEVQEAVKQLLVAQKRQELAENLRAELLKKSRLVLNDRVLKKLAEKKGKSTSPKTAPAAPPRPPGPQPQGPPEPQLHQGHPAPHGAHHG
jgi:parvulin-like peptidyl-prolyl isomerase